MYAFTSSKIKASTSSVLKLFLHPKRTNLEHLYISIIYNFVSPKSLTYLQLARENGSRDLWPSLCAYSSEFTTGSFSELPFVLNNFTLSPVVSTSSHPVTTIDYAWQSWQHVCLSNEEKSAIKQLVLKIMKIVILSKTYLLTESFYIK